jgi:hypothetical protein
MALFLSVSTGASGRVETAQARSKRRTATTRHGG